MNHRKGFNPLSRTSSHRKAMSRNMATSLFRYERITTTKAKALEVRKAAEKMITRAKVDTVHNRRQIARFISDPAILAKLFTDIGPRMKDRKGGYTRVLKLGLRQGDAAELVILELVDYQFDAEKKEKAPAKKEKAEAKKESAPKKEKATEKKAAPKSTKAKSEPKAKVAEKPASTPEAEAEA